MLSKRYWKAQSCDLSQTVSLIPPVVRLLLKSLIQGSYLTVVSTDLELVNQCCPTYSHLGYPSQHV